MKKSNKDEIMIKKINLKEREIEYILQRKPVKNINLRIKQDGSISVSANRFVAQSTIESFIISKSDFILNAIKMFEKDAKKPLVKYFEEKEITTVVTELCKKVYPYFKEKGIKYPEIRFRRMVSQWGNCRSKDGILTFNTNLMYAPIECIEYVVLHEFTHFIEANHSPAFYRELEKVCPDWKNRRKQMKSIKLR